MNQSLDRLLFVDWDGEVKKAINDIYKIRCEELEEKNNKVSESEYVIEMCESIVEYLEYRLAPKKPWYMFWRH